MALVWILHVLALMLVNEVDLARRVNVEDWIRENRISTKRSGRGSEALGTFLNLTEGEGVEFATSITLPQGEVKKRMLETYFGIPVFGTLVVTDDLQEEVTGSIVQDIHEDIPSIKPKYSEQWAIDKVLRLEGDDQKKLDFTHKRAEKWIYVDTVDGKHIARLAYLVDYFVESATKLSRPMYFLDAMTEEVLLNWQGFDTRTRQITGKGGNIKIGGYVFGSNGYGKLKISRRGRDCVMENDHVRVINLNHQTVEHKNPVVLPSCHHGFNDSINGAFSPANDALYFGTAVWNMYKRWFNVDVLISKIILRVHYGKQYDNAFWNGDEVTFGDGNEILFPLVSRDITAHEIGHGFTEQNSGLLYFGQSGGINEAFSDMSAKALESFVKGKESSVNWQFGYDITKSKKPLRYMRSPADDGKSIEHALQFHRGLDVHQSSGVFNKAFYLLSSLPGWNIKKAFSVFVLANVLYWTPRSDFNHAACGLIRAAKDSGLGVQDVKKVLLVVGVSCDPSERPVVRLLQLGIPTSGLSGSVDSLQFFEISINEDGKDLIVTTYAGQGDCDVFIKLGKPPTTSQYDHISRRTGSVAEKIVIPSAISGTYFIMIRGVNPFKNVKLTVQVDEDCPACRSSSLRNGIPVTGLSAEKCQILRFQFEVPGKCSVRIETYGGDGDADLYVRFNSEPTINLWDYRPYIWGNEETVSDPGSDESSVYHIMIFGSENFHGLTLKGNYECSNGAR